MSASAKEVPVIVITGAHPRLYNHDLAPTAPEGRTWGVFSLFAMWMSDVHSVGGYTFAASLFLFGLTGWQVLLSMAVGILDRLLPDEPDRPAVAARGHPLPGDGAHLARRDGRQPRRHDPRRRRHRLVRRADLLRLQGGGDDHPALRRPRRRRCTNSGFVGPRHARLDQLPVHVVLPAADLPARHGDDPQVHRLLRPGRLRRDVRADGLDPLPRRLRLAEPARSATCSSTGGADHRRT